MSNKIKMAQIERDIICDRNLSHVQFRLLAYLLSQNNHSPSYSEIKRDLGISKSSISTAIRKLVDHKYLKYTQREDGTSNTYLLLNKSKKTASSQCVNGWDKEAIKVLEEWERGSDELPNKIKPVDNHVGFDLLGRIAIKLRELSLKENIYPNDIIQSIKNLVEVKKLGDDTWYQGATLIGPYLGLRRTKGQYVDFLPGEFHIDRFRRNNKATEHLDKSTPKEWIEIISEEMQQHRR